MIGVTEEAALRSASTLGGTPAAAVNHKGASFDGSAVKGLSIQIVYFHQRNAGRIVHATHDRGIITGWQVGDDCRLT